MSFWSRLTGTEPEPQRKEETMPEPFENRPYSDDPAPETTARMQLPMPVPPPERTAFFTDEPEDVPEVVAGTPEDAPMSGMMPLAEASKANAESDAAEDEEGHADCPTCYQKVPTIRDSLNDIFRKIDTRSDAFVIAVYTDIAHARPDVLHMFPDDLIDPHSTGRGRAQRDKLVHGLLAAASLYNPTSPKALRKLNQALDTWATTHGESRMWVADDQWPGGRRPLLQQEYDDVNACLVPQARAFYGDGWTPLHHAALWTALTYVSNYMGAKQILAAPRHAAD